MMRYGIGFGPHGFMGGGFGLLMGLFMVLLLVLVILGIWVLVRYLRRTSQAPEAPRPEHKALEILNERYVRGEITDDEYAVKKSTLMKL